eukprot:5887632-Amphidinium_carterae.1
MEEGFTQDEERLIAEVDEVIQILADFEDTEQAEEEDDEELMPKDVDPPEAAQEGPIRPLQPAVPIGAPRGQNCQI